MRLRLSLIAILAACIPLTASAADNHPPKLNAEGALATLFSRLDLESARKLSSLILSHDPDNALALFIRMEVAQLEAQTSVVLDSALRLCSSNAPQNVSDIASGRILEYAGNTPAFHAMIPRIETATRQESKCSFNLRLALVAAAADGDATLDLDRTANSAGLLTRWRVAGPFGHYRNADFDSKWAPESDRFSHSSYGELQPEELWFRDGLFILPDYFSSAGVFYTASDIEPGQMKDAVLQVFSPGSYSVFVDGKLLLAHDSRYAVKPGQDSAALKLDAGKHRVMIKFTLDAVPFRVAIHPQSKSMSAKDVFDAGPLSNYIEGLTAYLRDDLPALARATRPDSSGATQYLRALLYSATDGNSSQARAAWQALVPIALARLKLAEMAVDTETTPAGEFRQEISAMAKTLPDSEAAQHLAFAALNDEDALKRLIALHPSCSNLSQALKFFTARGNQDQSPSLEEQLAKCAPESLLYPQVLAVAGRHSEAADYLLKLLGSNASNRPARRMLLDELLLGSAGREKEAQDQAQRLHEIAPNSADFARFAADPYTALDASSGRAGGFPEQDQFYVPYRRSALKIIQKVSQRHFAGGSSVTLLSDRVLELQAGGSISVYTHHVTRMLNKDGISRFGEVSIPRDADLLELRTIKSTGQTIEPEVSLQKPTISMSALEPGDIIDEEFVVHYPDWDEVPDDAAEFTFGSFNSPILYSRFVLITSEGMPIKISEANDAPRSRVEHLQGRGIQTWERNDIAQTKVENDLPPENQLPFVTIAPAENAQARLRDDLISATRIGIQVERVSQSFKESGRTEYEKARQLYRFVTSKIQSLGPDWSAYSAEDTLLNSEGSRTAALLALAHVTRLKAGLILAEKTGQHCLENADFNCSTTPLVRFWFADGSIVDADAESSGLAFGEIPGDLNAENAALVPLTVEDQAAPLRVTLVPKVSNEKSEAEGQLFLDENGTMAVELNVRLGAARGQQVRNLLRGTNQHERQMFFDQLAIRIFPGAASVRGSSLHEDDPEQPLELTLHCHVPGPLPRAALAPDSAELDQLAPALGLHEMYATSLTRKSPLYIASVLFESTSFHLRLAPGFQLRSLPADFTGTTEFGNYAVRFSSSGQQITIHREFQIPVQVVSPQKYEAFANFARQIDEAERRKILLSFHAVTARNSLRIPANANK